MENTLRWYSPRSGAGSFFSSIAVHLFLAGACVLAVGLGLVKSHPPEGEVQVDYQVLDEPPAPTPVVRQVRRSSEPVTPVAQNLQPRDMPKEIQDEKGVVAGTQAAPKPIPNPGSDSAG